ncbi:MAG TPA: hypothetical protein VIW03_12415 [Anaeromyxobacter sp.]
MTTSGRAVHVRKAGPEHCIALAGKGTPGSGDLEDAIEAVIRVARSLREITRRRGHEWKPGDPEVRLRTPTGPRGGAGWIVRVAVPLFVTARDVHAAATDAAERLDVAKNIRLAPRDPSKPGPAPAHPGRDRLPGQIRRTRAGAPQHRARDLR